MAKFKCFQTTFEDLNPETLSNQVMKYAKTVMQLEKGLPPNSVVPILKEKVEGMRHKVKNVLSSVSQDYIESTVNTSRTHTSWYCALALSHGLVLLIGSTSLHLFPLDRIVQEKLLTMTMTLKVGESPEKGSAIVHG